MSSHISIQMGYCPFWKLLPVPLLRCHNSIIPAALSTDASHMYTRPATCCATWLDISCSCQQMSLQTLRLIMLCRMANISSFVTTENILDPEPLVTVSGSSSVNAMALVIGASIFSAFIFSLIALYLKKSCRKSLELKI